ncbi:MAG: Asp-tRNA(Asn)/Glu-tRNA(Gln) amidotransferase subunit GatC [Rhodospirillaceae bacterium]
MLLNDTTVQQIAVLARINIPKEDLASLGKELGVILDWIEQLQEVDTETVEPMTGGSDQTLTWRADGISDGGYAEKVLANAPESHEGFFGVPKVVE